jgi:hypothetical protein
MWPVLAARRYVAILYRALPGTFASAYWAPAPGRETRRGALARPLDALHEVHQANALAAMRGEPVDTAKCRVSTGQDIRGC